MQDPSQREQRGPVDETIAWTSESEAVRIAAGGQAYRRLEEIGRGGMGVVWRVWDETLERPLAMKFLRSREGGAEARFLKEAQVTGRLQHPGVAPIHELGRLSDGAPYFTMKLIAGETLAELLARRREASDDRQALLAVFDQVAQTLAFAHSVAIVHRDLKPSNIMVGAFGEVQVMDWGLALQMLEDSSTTSTATSTSEGLANDVTDATLDYPVSTDTEAGNAERDTNSTHPRRGDETAHYEPLVPAAAGRPSVPDHRLTLEGQIMGTPAYMAPEQARGESSRIDRRSDVFGLGAVLCEILTGQPPFVGPATEAVRQAQQADLSNVQPLLEAESDAPALARIALDCLAPDPDDRPADAGVVATRVQQHLREVGERLKRAELARAAAEAKAQEELRARRIGIVLSCTAGLLVCLTVAAVAWYRQDRAARRAEAELTEALGRRALLETVGEAGRLRQDGNWRSAAALLEDGRERRQRLPDDPELDAALRSAELDLELRRQAEQYRLRRSTFRDARYDEDFLLGPDGGYARLLQRYARDRLEIARPLDDPRAVLAALDDRAVPDDVRLTLVSVLDDWCVLEQQGDHIDLARDLAAELDPAPWRRLELLKDPDALQQYVESLNAEALSPEGSLMIVRQLRTHGKHRLAASLLQRSVLEHPDGFWLHMELADVLRYEMPERARDAVPVYLAALAAKPVGAAYNNLGALLARLGDEAGAERAFRLAVEAQPDLDNGWSNLALALAKQGRLEEVEQLQAQPGLDEATVLSIARTLAEYREDWVEAERLARRLLRRQPQEPTLYSQLAVALHRQERFHDAVRVLRWAGAAVPLDPDVQMALAIALAKVGDMDGAIQSARRSTELDPTRAEHWSNLSRLLGAGRQLEAAAEAGRRALDLEPANAQYAFRLGALLMQLERWEPAREVARVDGEHPQLQLLLSAIDEQEQASRQAGSEAQAETPEQRWQLLIEGGRVTSAEAMVRAQLEASPDEGRWWLMLARTLERRGQFEAAQEASESAVSRLDELPVLAEAYGQLARCLVARSRIDEAEQAVRDALELQPKDARWLVQLAHVLALQGDRAQAVSVYQQVLRSDPTPQTRVDYGGLLMQVGDFEAAEPQLKQALDESDPEATLRATAVSHLLDLYRWRSLAKALETELAAPESIDDGYRCLLLARLCLRYLDRPAAALVFARRGLELDPGLARERPPVTRLLAAEAALAAAATKPADAQRLQQEALGYLLEDLKYWESLPSEHAPQAARVGYVTSLFASPILAATREREGVPNGDAWQTYWQSLLQLARS